MNYKDTPFRAYISQKYPHLVEEFTPIWKEEDRDKAIQENGKQLWRRKKYRTKKDV